MTFEIFYLIDPWRHGIYLFFFNKEEAKIDNDDVVSLSVLQKIIVKNQSKYLHVSASHIIYLIHT